MMLFTGFAAWDDVPGAVVANAGAKSVRWFVQRTTFQSQILSVRHERSDACVLHATVFDGRYHARS